MEGLGELRKKRCKTGVKKEGRKVRMEKNEGDKKVEEGKEDGIKKGR